MGTNERDKTIDFYKVQDDEVRAFLKEKYAASSVDEYWKQRYDFWAKDENEYHQSLARRRFGLRGKLGQQEFYNENSTLVLSRSSEATLEPRNSRELLDLIGIIGDEDDQDVLKDLLETFVKPLALRYIESRSIAHELRIARETREGWFTSAGFSSDQSINKIISLLKTWVQAEDSNEQMIKNLKEISSDFFSAGPYPTASSYLSIIRNRVTYFDDTNRGLHLGDFLNILTGGDNRTNAHIKEDYEKNYLSAIEALGFINKTIESGFDKDNNLLDIENALNTGGDSEAANALEKLRQNIENSNVDRSLKDDDEILKMRQCFLMSQQKWQLTGTPRFAPEWENNNVKMTDYFAGVSKIKRIYRTQESKYLLNKLIGNKVFRGLWYGDANTRLSMFKKLYWVFTDSSGNLKQEELFLTQDRLVEDYWNNLFQTDEQLSPSDFTMAEEEHKKNFGAWESLENLRKGHYYLKNVNVVYEGTNPSTARKDVQVEMEFQISSLAALDLPISNRIVFDEKTGEGYFVKLFNLITLPVTNKIGERTGMGTINAAAYDPDYSRVRLVVYENEFDTDCISVDLSTIDHSISRDSSTGACTLKINYRGYFEQVLTMPFTDVLATRDKREKRRAIDAQMEIIRNGDICSAAALRTARQIEADWYKNNTAKEKSSRFISDLFERGLLYEYEFSAMPLITAYKTGEAPATKVVNYFIKQNPEGARNGPLFDENGQMIDNITDEVFKKYVQPASEEQSWFDQYWEAVQFYKDTKEEVYRGSCFFLGDLFNLAVEGIYEDEETRKKLKLEFLFGSIDTTGIYSSKSELQNPLNFPVDVVVFMKWFEQRVVAKKISFYPLTTFLRDLLQTLLIDLKTQFCSYDNEEPPMYRMAFINTTTMDDFLPTDDDVDMDNPFGTGPIEGVPVLERSPFQTDDETRNYCVFYQQTESRFQTVKYNDREHTPRIFYGMKNNKWNYISDVSFSKTDAPHLREARYFNNNFGDLSLLSNVYNLSFSFKNRCANKDFYPGTIFEFVLLDWGPEWVDENPINKVPIVDGAAGDYGVFGEANPHRLGTISNVTGFGGYYIATKVDYILGETSRDFEIKIEAKFIGANESLLMRRGKQDKNVAQPDSVLTDEQCLEELRRIAHVPKPKDNGENNIADEE